MTPELEQMRKTLILYTEQGAFEASARVERLKQLQQDAPTSDTREALAAAETKLRKMNHMLDFYRRHPLKPIPF